MRAVDPAAFRARLLTLVSGPLQHRRPSTCRIPVDGSTGLFEDGVIDSLSVVELIAFVEEETGCPVPPRMVDLRHFGTIDRICASFCAPPGRTR